MMTTVWVPGADRTCGTKYRAWLVRYALHVARMLVRAHGAFTLSEIVRVCEEDGVLDGFDRRGDRWALDVVSRGFFTKRAHEADVYVPVEDADLEVLAHPGKPPRSVFENANGTYQYEAQAFDAEGTDGQTIHRAAAQLERNRRCAKR